jgi:hypothetical protein
VKWGDGWYWRFAHRQSRPIVPRAWLAVACARGADTFSDAEMEDPALRSRNDMRNPCRVFGPLTLEFYTDLFGIRRP